MKQLCWQRTAPNLQTGLKQLSLVAFLSSLHSTEQPGRGLYTANQVLYYMMLQRVRCSCSGKGIAILQRGTLGTRKVKIGVLAVARVEEPV